MVLPCGLARSWFAALGRVDLEGFDRGRRGVDASAAAKAEETHLHIRRRFERLAISPRISAGARSVAEWCRRGGGAEPRHVYRRRPRVQASARRYGTAACVLVVLLGDQQSNPEHRVYQIRGAVQ